MRDDEEFEESIDELISYDEADEVDDFSDFYDESSASEATESDDAVSENYEDDESFDIDDDYASEPYDTAEEAAPAEIEAQDETENLPAENVSNEDTELADEDFDEDFDEDRVTGDKKTLRFIGIGLAAAVVITALIAFFSIDTGFIAQYKVNFANNFNSLFGNLFKPNPMTQQYEEPKEESRYNTVIQNSTIISPGNIINAKILPYKDGVICASPNHLSFIDSSGKVSWEENTLIVDPILSVQGSYILIAEKGRHKLCLYTDKKLIYETDDPDTIKSARVSQTGDCILITDKSTYRGGISVYNKIGEQIYSWASGSYAVIAADIASPSRKIAVSLLNTDTEVKSTIMFFDVNEDKSYSQINVEDSVIYNLTFTGNTLTAFGDNRITVLSENGEVVSDNIMDDVQLTHSAIDAGGTKIISYDNGIVPMISTYDKNGKEISTNEINGICSFIDVEDKTVVYSIGKDIYCGRTSIDNMTKYTAAMDIKKLMLISQNTFVIVYTNSIEIVRI